MRVFYVVVLVLVAYLLFVVVLVWVAGAVPSHERTESEGTVFDKIQPHESMSNVTVSSSKLETYEFSYLAMQWPRSFCKNRPCKQSVPARFTVHGLWPQYSRTHSVDCGRINRRYRPFNIQLPNFVRDFRGRLNYHWPDLTRGKGDNHIFWGIEYNKHGSCTFNNQTRYFELTLELARNFGNLNSGPTGFQGIVFDRPHSSNFIRSAVQRVTTLWPSLYCVTAGHGNRLLLLEIRFCVLQNRLTNCTYYTDCGNRNVYLPRPY